MQVDIYSDNICPWCYIGKKHFDQAVTNLGLTDVAVRWHAYQLYPQIPAGGVPRKEFMRARFGSGGGEAGDAFKRITEIGKEAGIQFAFDRMQLIPNTFDSHRLLEYAASEGCQHETVAALLAAGFEQGRDIGQQEVLVDVAVACGLDRADTLEMLVSGRFAEEVQESLQWCMQAGVAGVPLFRLGNGEVIHGAQPVPVMQMVLESAAAETS